MHSYDVEAIDLAKSRTPGTGEHDAAGAARRDVHVQPP